MELKRYLNIIYKRYWLIILLPLIAAGISAVFSYFVIEPVYESNITLYVINKKTEPQMTIAYNDLLVSQQLVNDYRELIKSRTVTGAVIENLKLSNIKPEGLAQKISVSSKNDTRIIEIRVRDNEPEIAKDIAGIVGTVFIEKAVDLMKVETVSIVDDARMPEGPVEPKPIINIAIAFFAGLVIAIGIVFLVEYVDDTIKSPEDVEKYLELSVLGTIPLLETK